MFNNRFLCPLRLAWVQPWAIRASSAACLGPRQQGWASHPSSAVGAQCMATACASSASSSHGPPLEEHSSAPPQTEEPTGYVIHDPIPALPLTVSPGTLPTSWVACVPLTSTPLNSLLMTQESLWGVHAPWGTRWGFVFGSSGTLSSFWPLPWVAERGWYLGRKGRVVQTIEVSSPYPIVSHLVKATSHLKFKFNGSWATSLFLLPQLTLLLPFLPPALCTPPQTKAHLARNLFI